MLTNFSYVRATSVKEAVRHLSAENDRVHAGGTDLLGCLRDHVLGADKVVSISRIRELGGIRETGEGLRIGALTTVAEVAENPIVRRKYQALAEAASSVGSPQLRNQGTIGGNICQKPRCWYYRGEFHCLRKGGSLCYAASGENQFHCIIGGGPCYIVHPSDIASALVALRALVRIAGPRGARTVEAEHFHILPSRDVHRETILEHNEIVTDIVVPAMHENFRSNYRKVRARRSWNFAIAGLALALQFSGASITQARVVLTAAAPVPWRIKETEKVLTGGKLNATTVERAVDVVMKNARPLGKNGYKIPLFRGILEEQLLAIA